MRFIYKYSVTNLKNFLESNQFIDYNIWYHKNRHPIHDLPQTCGGGKSVCANLDTAHLQFSDTPEDKFQYQWMIIQ